MLRFLLDQNFPQAPLDISAVDKLVTYAHVAVELPQLVQTSTPDWLIYLAACNAGFDGLVTGDVHQVQQDEEAIALQSTGLTIVTWSKGTSNPIAQWGSLLAYMPQIRRVVEKHGAIVVTLPVPTLQSSSWSLTRKTLARHASHRKRTQKALKEASIDDMREELDHRGLQALLPLLDRRGPPRARGA